VTRRLDDEGGGNWLEVDYLFRPHRTVKLTFRLHVSTADQYRIRFQNSGIAGEVTEVPVSDIFYPALSGIDRLVFDRVRFSWSPDEIGIHSGYIIEDQANGKKLDFFLGVFDLPDDGDVTISPTTWGATETSDDCASRVNTGQYYDESSGLIGVGSYSLNYYYTGWIWSNVTVPAGATLTDGCLITVTAGAELGNGIDDGTLKAVDENPVPAWSSSELPEDKAVYGTTVDWNLEQSSGSHDSPELKTMLQQIFDDAAWDSGDNLGVIWIDNSPGGNNYQAIVAEESGNGATLTIVYTAGGATQKTAEGNAGRFAAALSKKLMAKRSIEGQI
jgi:hypothetical protein